MDMPVNGGKKISGLSIRWYLCDVSVRKASSFCGRESSGQDGGSAHIGLPRLPSLLRDWHYQEDAIMVEVKEWATGHDVLTLGG